MSKSYIDPRFWDDVSGYAPEAQMMWSVLLTHQYGQLVPGLLRLGLAALVEERGLPIKTILDGIEILKQAALVIHDDRDKVRLFRMPRAPLYYSPPGPTNLHGIWRHWQTMPESPLKYAHVESIRQTCKLDGGASPVAQVWAATFGTLSNRTVISSPQENLKLPLFYQRDRSPIDPPSIGGVYPPDQDPDQDQDQKQDQERSGDPDPDANTETEFQLATGTDPGNVLPVPTALMLQDRARRAWKRQEDLRAGISGMMALQPTAERLQRVEACLARTGASDVQVDHVLAVYAHNAADNPEHAKWFDGISNWVPENFERSVGKPIGGHAGGYFKPTGKTKYKGGRVF